MRRIQKNQQTRAIDPVVLRRLYVDEQRSAAQVARILGVRNQTVSDALQAHAVPRHQRGRHVAAPCQLDAAALYTAYVDQQQTITNIAQQFGISRRQVHHQLIAAQIPRRPPAPRRDRPPLCPEQQQQLARWVTAWGMRVTVQRLKRVDPTVRSPQIVAALMGQAPKMRGVTRTVDDQAVRAAYANGQSAQEIAAVLQRHPRAIYRSLQRTCVQAISVYRNECEIV